MTIYFVRHPEDGLIKIGYTSDFHTRIIQLNTEYNTSLELMGVHEGGIAEEKQLHAEFGKHNRFGEWFRPVDEIMTYIGKNTSKNLPPQVPKKRKTKGSQVLITWNAEMYELAKAVVDEYSADMKAAGIRPHINGKINTSGAIAFALMKMGKKK